MSGNNDEVSLSIDETNALRIKLGLKPLNEDKKKAVVFVNTRDAAASASTDDAIKRRIEGSKLSRKGNEIKATSLSETSSSAAGSASEWVRSMRSSSRGKGKTSGNAPQQATIAASESAQAQEYGSKDLSGMNVGHSAAAFDAGTSTILTMADSNILETGDNGVYSGINDQEVVLENVNLAETERVSKAKKKKQMLSSMKYSGGYSGWDDDEFEELGGSGVPSRSSASQSASVLSKYNDEDAEKKRGHGFALDSSGALGADASELGASEFDSQMNNDEDVAISLKADYGMATDYLTQEEVDASKKSKKGRKKKEKEKKKTKEFKKKKKKDKSKDGGQAKQKVRQDSDSQSEGEDEGSLILAQFKKKRAKKEAPVQSSLLSELESTADSTASDSATSKREAALTAKQREEKQSDQQKRKLEKFHETMQKGNKRIKRNAASSAANGDSAETAEAAPEGETLGGAADEPSLQAAIKKAERMKKLKQMRAQRNGTAVPIKTDVVDLINQASNLPDSNPNIVKSSNEESMTFDFGTTAEFTRKLGDSIKNKNVESTAAAAAAAVTSTNTDAAASKSDDMLTMEEMVEMARGIKNEDEFERQLEGMEDGVLKEDDASTNKDVATNMMGLSSAKSSGLSGVLSMLRATGELSGKDAGKEELRGRSNDVKTYEDYEDLNLDSVVNMDRSKLKDKDLLYTKRQVNLEYRDDHGRLLTRKEAFRQLCYKFHGYGSGKKNQEKRLNRIKFEREAREKRATQDKGTMGSLLKAQEATGKAFIVHRT